MKIELTSINNEDCLKFIFDEDLKKEETEKIINEWLSLLNTEEKINYIWDCSIMKTYDKESLTIWQKILKEHEQYIDTIFLKTDSKSVKIGAKILNTFVKFKLKIVKNI